VEFEADAPLLDVNVGRPSISRPELTDFELGEVGAFGGLDVSRPGLPSRPDLPARPNAPDVRGAAAGRVQGAAIDLERAEQRIRTASPKSVIDSASGRVRGVGERAQSRGAQAAQRTTLEVEAARAELAEGDVPSIIQPDIDVPRPSARAAAAGARQRLSEVSTPDVTAALGRVRTRAFLEGEAAVFNLRRRASGVVRGGRRRLGRAAVEAEVARAEVAEGDVPSILRPGVDLPGVRSRGSLTPDVDVPPFRDITIRVGERESGGPSTRLLSEGDIQDTPLDLEVPRDTEAQGGQEVVAPVPTVEGGRGQVRDVRTVTETEQEAEPVGVGEEFDLRAGLERRDSPLGPTELGTGVDERVGPTFDEVYGPTFEQERVAGPTQRLDTVTEQDLGVDQTVRPTLEVGVRQEFETEPELETEVETEFETEFETEQELETETEQEFELEAEFEAEGESEYELEPFALDPDLDGDVPGLGRGFASGEQLTDFVDPLTGDVLRTR